MIAKRVILSLLIIYAIPAITWLLFSLSFRTFNVYAWPYYIQSWFWVMAVLGMIYGIKIVMIIFKKPAVRRRRFRVK